jgi:hypothetical protein
MGNMSTHLEMAVIAPYFGTAVDKRLNAAQTFFMSIERHMCNGGLYSTVDATLRPLTHVPTETKPVYSRSVSGSLAEIPPSGFLTS